MDDDIAIKVDHVSKKYCKSLKSSMLYGVNDIARNSLGFSSHSERLRNEEFWAVDDVSFELKKGETLGVIGPNGSGKTTLLKMLNGIFWPDKGKITIKGKVGALIEVGAGFHPMLTGRENIYVNGAILGMSKKEIDEKFKDIVAFADIGDFLDSPVKTYSSGMYVRLGFAVAIHCEPDILLVDEILAVGDINFRNKCFKKMNELKYNTKTTIILVSHSLISVGNFCEKGLLLGHGKPLSYGSIDTVIRNYQKLEDELLSNPDYNKKKSDSEQIIANEVKIVSVSILDNNRITTKEIQRGQNLIIRVIFDAKRTIDKPSFQFSIWDSSGKLISVLGPHLEGTQIQSIPKGQGTVECIISNIPLLKNSYYINVGIYNEDRTIIYDWVGNRKNPALSFIVLPDSISVMMGEYTGICHLDSKWEIQHS